MAVELLALLGLVGCPVEAEDCFADAATLHCEDFPGFVPWGVETGTRVGGLSLSMVDVSIGGTYRSTSSCEAGCVPAGVVGAEVCADATCGGDPTGTWNYTVSCGETAGNPFGRTCPEGSTDDTWTIDGTLSLASDGTFEKSVASQQLVHTLSLPVACTGGITSCSELEYGLSCSGAPRDGGCMCVDVLAVGDSTLRGTWDITVSTLNFHPEGARDFSAVFCVSASGLTLDDGVTIDVLTR